MPPSPTTNAFFLALYLFFMLPLFVFLFLFQLCVFVSVQIHLRQQELALFFRLKLCVALNLNQNRKPEPGTKKKIYIYIYDDRRGEATKSRLLGALAFVVSQFWPSVMVVKIPKRCRRHVAKFQAQVEMAAKVCSTLTRSAKN